MTGQDIAEAEKKKNQRNINELDNEAFMKLFLEQLKNQDPTAPMETDKIITQTAQLTQVEMMEQNKKTMMEVADAMKSTKEVNEELKKFQESFKTSLESLNKGVDTGAKASDNMTQMASFNTVAMIGKIAETDIFGIDLQEGGEAKFSLYFDEPIDTSKGHPTITILDKDNNFVNSIDLDDKNGESGYLEFTWNGEQKGGKKAPSGTYHIKAEYNLDEKSGKYHESRIGRGEVQSVIFKEGKPMLRMGEMIVPIASALEFYEKSAK
ncbi:flagellar basal body rod modification protein [Helicobacter brantae]|uniref:Basal-body rod modification protein FlgD n=2 Tax=Helicobacter brantae TaxID=375927 RepID=A0A3D8J136_9HELI|nr:flagellar hook assembly protein FlgD [Helicobacter brantae]RDU71227.1 flagellar basal body rod modification protein [Helicobacter brantae]